MSNPTIRAPTYQYVPHDGGYAHLKEYTCVCRVDHFNLEVKERRKNQKEARKAAATQECFKNKNELPDKMGNRTW